MNNKRLADQCKHPLSLRQKNADGSQTCEGCGQIFRDRLAYRITKGWKSADRWNGYSGNNLEEFEANAELIAEAFNVTNSTGLSPRELKEQRDELYELLDRIDTYFVYGDSSVPKKVRDETRSILNKVKPQTT